MQDSPALSGFPSEAALPRLVNLARGQNSILELIAAGAPLVDTLTALVRFIEQDLPDMLGSILLLDADGVHLRHGAAPSLPPAYSAAIDGASIGPRAGSCGTAAFLKQQIVVTDTAVDALWHDYRDLAGQHGLRACWSTPILRGSTVIGTFAMYFREPRAPTATHFELIGIATHIAAIAIGKHIREATIRESEERYRLINLATNDAVWDWNLKTNTIWRNDGAERLFGYRPEDVANELTWWADRLHPDDRVRVRDSLHASVASDTSKWQEDYRFLRRDGTYADIQDRGYVMRDESGAAIRMIGMMQDISERRQAQAAIEHLAYHEPVTQLSNRLAMKRELARAVSEARRDGRPLSLLLLNLNYFRDINDSLGHDKGDRLLQLVAGRLLETVGPEGHVASLGGDEFAVLLSHGSSDHVRAVATVQRCLQQPFNLTGIPIKLEATAGIASFPKDGNAPELVWQHADVALRTAKERRAPFLCYDTGIDHYDPNRLALIAELDAAIAADHLVLHYQPKVALLTGRTVGVEALIRWAHPVRGMVPPDAFLPLAERTDLINPLTRWLVKRAVRDAIALRDQGLPPLDVAVNISARSLHDEQFCTELVASVRDSGLALSHLTLEVTETAIVSDPTRVRAGLELFRAAGLHIAMDDFGVGQSSLTYLKDLPITKMKIDKSFVMGLEAVHNAAIVRSAIDMGRNLQLEVTAEGVEQEQSYFALRTMGCDLGQGYLFSPPLPFDALREWLRQSRWAA